MHLTDESFKACNKYKDDLTFLFIVSQVDLEKEDKGENKVEVFPARGKKCARCWNYRLDTGSDEQHPTICLRCAEAVKQLA